MRKSLAPRPLASSLARYSSAAAVCAALAASTAHAQNVWTANSGTDFSWDTIGNWSLGAKPTAATAAIFPSPIPNPLTLANAGVITLTAGEVASSLNFEDFYTLRGGDLALTTGDITVAAAKSVSIGSVLTGTGGLDKIGSGSLVLTGTSTFTGPVTVTGGSLVVTNNSSLGALANTIDLNGGTLRFTNQSSSANPPNNFGAGHGRVTRFINFGAAGGTVDVPSQNIVAFDNVNTFTGTGVFTKMGLGEMQIVASNNFPGAITLAPSGGSIHLRASGKLTGASNITVGTGSNFVIENQNSVGLFASNNDNDRVANSIPFTLQGGQIIFVARNSTTAGQSAETLGTVTLGQGQSFISLNRNGGLGADLTISNLVRQAGNIVRFSSGSGTLGAAGDNSRIILTQVNGAATPTGAPVGINPPGFLGGWALFGSGDFANHTSAALGVQSAAYTTLTTANFGPTVLGQITGADLTVGTVGTPANFEVLSLKLSDAATRQLLFSNATDTLYVAQGGILGSDNNNSKNIGVTAAATRGRVTAGTVAGGGLRELFLLQNQGTMTVNSEIIDNPISGPGVSVTKGLDATVVLAGANSYSGGTNVFRGTLQANVGGALGSGAVVVKGNARLNLNAAGAVTAGAGIEVKDGAEVFLNGGGVSWTQTGDRFTIRTGSSVIVNQNNTGGVPNANQGGNSLTRTLVAPAAGGEVFLEAGAIVAHNSAFNGENGSDANNSTIKNLGTNADIFFGLAATFNAGSSQAVTLGAGTPWMGMSTDPRAGRAWQQGTITLNGDVIFQGGLSSGTLQTLTLGGNAVAGAYSIVNASGAPVRIFTGNNVTLDEDSAVNIAPDVTFVVQSGSTLFANRTNSFGSGANLAAGVVVQAGGTLDPGGFRTAPTTNVPAVGPLNAPVTIEGGGRLLLNDTSGLGSGGTITVQREGIIDVSNNAGALLGTTAGQFDFQAGSIVRLNFDNVFELSKITGAATGTTNAIFQIFGGTRTLTNQTDMFAVAAIGSPTILPESFTIGTGGGLTNDSNSRTLNEGRGRVIINGSATISATTGTTFSVQEGIDLLTGSTLNIGAVDVNGNPKRGDVRFTGANSNTGDASTTINITGAGTRLFLGANNVLPDAATVNIETGGSLVLDITNQIETIGGLTGGGSVITNQTGAQLAIRANTSQTLGATLATGGTQQPNLTKYGTGNLTLNTAHTSTGELRAEEGTVTLSGAGSSQFSNVRLGKGGALVLDNSTSSLGNRLGGTTKNISGQGGALRLVGGASAVTEAINQLNNGGSPAGSLSYINVEPGAGTTTFTAASIENFNGSGGRQTTWVFRSPSLDNLPGIYSASGVLSVNPANDTNGLISVTSPRFTSNGAFDQQANQIVGAAGTPVAATRPDVLGDADLNGLGDGFTTQDSAAAGFRLLASSEYANYFRDNQSVPLNVKLAGTTTTSGDTRVQTLTLTPGSTLNIAGDLPLNLTPSRLHLNGSGVFVQSGGAASTINGADTYLQFQGSTMGYLHTQGDLNVNAQLFSDTGIVKTGTGALNLGTGAAKIFRGALTIDAGAVNLASDNGFFTTRGTNGFSAINLTINGGALNLGGNSQMVNSLNSSNVLAGTGGTLGSTGAATVTVLGGGSFSGQIAGAISLDKLNGNTLLLTGANPYTGATSVRSGTLQLRDSGALTGTTAVEVRYSTLSLDNGALENVTNRIPAAVPVNLMGGSINLTGAPGQVASQAFGTVTLQGGRSDFNSNAGGGGANEITIANLNRAAGSGATVSFNQSFGFLGTAGSNTTAIRDVIGAVNGTPIAAALVNNILPAWIIANGDHFATYDATRGLSFLSNTGDGFATYESTDVTAAASTNNVNDGTARTLTTSKTVNAWRIAPNAAVVNTLNGNVVLTLASGGLLTNNNNATSINPALNAIGQGLTSGTGELDVWVNQNNTGINVPITGAIDFVKSGGGNLNLNPALQFNNGASNSTTNLSNVVTLASTTGLAVGQPVSGTGIPIGATITQVNSATQITISAAANATGANTILIPQANTYTGKTFVSAGTLSGNMVNADGATFVTIPGDLEVQNATFTEAFAHQLKTNANVTLTGSGTMNLANLPAITETLASVVFKDVGGAGGSLNLTRGGLQMSSVLNLTAATAISSDNTNPITVPIINQNIGVLGFTGAGAKSIQVTGPVSTNGVGTVGLRIDAQIGAVPSGVAEGGLVKTGSGILVLNPTATAGFAGGVTVANSNVLSMTSTAGLFVGQSLTGTNIPGNTYITRILDGTTVQINQNTTTAGSAITFNAGLVSPFGSPVGLTDSFNLSQGVVRLDQGGAIGGNLVNTTVQSGAGLLAGVNIPIFGSVRLKSGSFLGTTINTNALFGTLTTTPGSQSIMEIAGDTTFYVNDYYIQGSNAATLNVAARLTGSSRINLVGPQITSGLGAGGVLVLANPVTSGTGSNTYTGTIAANVNTILEARPFLLPTATVTSVTGNTLGGATVELNGGRLRLRDDFSTANTSLINQTASYGNNVTLLADSFIDANRVSANAGITANTINLGTLTIPTGMRTLTVDSGNSYRVGFAQLDGAGTLVKAGNSQLNINGFAGTFTGSLVLAGPQGMSIAPSSALTLNSPASVPNFTINGFHQTNANAITVADTLEVGNNAGTVANGTNGMMGGALTGTLAVANSTALTAGTLRNNGVIGATGGAANISAASIQGTGHFQTFGQPLTVTGQLTNNGATASTLRVAGNNTFTLAATAAGSLTGGIEVQSGTLRVAPTAGGLANPLGTGTVRVLGAAADPAIGAAAIVPTLQFDSGTSTVTHGGNIENSGTVRVSSGTTTVSGNIMGTAVTYVPGLLEGVLTGTNAFDASANRAPNPGNFGIKLEPRMFQTSIVTQNAITGHLDNETWIYSGQFFDADGIFTFAENMDDNVMMVIDGVTRLLNNSGVNPYQTVTSTALSAGQRGATQDTASVNTGTPSLTFGMGPNGDGWHNIEIRMHNGAGGAGPVVGNGFTTNFGFGLNAAGTTALDGSLYQRPIDPGDASLFRTAVGGKGNVQVDSSATLNVAGLTGINEIRFGGNDALVNVTGTGANDATLITVTGGTLADPAALRVATGGTLTAQSLVAAAGANLTINDGTGTGAVNIAVSQLDAGSLIDIEAGRINFTGIGAAGVGGNGSLEVSAGATANIALGGSIQGSVSVLGGTLTGSGAVTGAVALTGGTIAPGSSPGILTVSTLTSDAASTFVMELGSNTAGTTYDQVVVTGGTVDIVGSTLSLAVTSPLATGDILTLVLNQGSDIDPGMFGALAGAGVSGSFANGGFINLPGGQQVQISYADDPSTANMLELAGGTSVSLLVTIPEPGSGATLLAGLGGLAGLRRFRRGVRRP